MFTAKFKIKAILQRTVNPLAQFREENDRVPSNKLSESLKHHPCSKKYPELARIASQAKLFKKIRFGSQEGYIRSFESWEAKRDREGKNSTTGRNPAIFKQSPEKESSIWFEGQIVINFQQNYRGIKKKSSKERKNIDPAPDQSALRTKRSPSKPSHLKNTRITENEKI